MPSGDNVYRVYVASRFKNIPLVRAFVAKVGTMRCLFADRIQFTSTWYNRETSWDEEMEARQDLQEIRDADAVWVLTDHCEQVPGGMHFEAGYAYGLGKSVVCIGPSVNIFYELQDIERKPSIDAFLQRHFEAPLG